MQPHSPPRQDRFLFIDALRGVAALAVLYHHMLHNSIMEVTLRRIMPLWSTLVSDWGRYGVQIFFVLSGFVITHSLRNSQINGKSMLRFIVRRQLRLDPPYWCALAIALAVQAARLHFPKLVTPPLPGFGAVVLNMLYLQTVLDTTSILGVAWTLCIEIQFYLVFIALLSLAARWKPEQRTTASAGLVIVTGGLSLAAIFLGDFGAWFIQYWFFFAAGALCYWAVRGLIDHRLFYGFAAVVAGGVALAAFGLPTANMVAQGVRAVTTAPAMFVGWGTAVLIYGVGRAGRLTTLWSNPVIQYFGRISYSLYLMHIVVTTAVLQAGYKLTGENPKMALVWFALSGLASIAAGHALFATVERPVMRFASRLRKRPSPARYRRNWRSQHSCESIRRSVRSGCSHGAPSPCPLWGQTRRRCAVATTCPSSAPVVARTVHGAGEISAATSASWTVRGRPGMNGRSNAR